MAPGMNLLAGMRVAESTRTTSMRRSLGQLLAAVKCPSWNCFLEYLGQLMSKGLDSDPETHSS